MLISFGHYVTGPDISKSFRVESSFNLTLKSQFLCVDTYRWVGMVLRSHGVLQKNR